MHLSHGTHTYLEILRLCWGHIGLACVAPLRQSVRGAAWQRAVCRLQAGKADVLVATDVASKGLDFPDIQHVINFDMPSEIENYVHRIGRTGRCGKTGIATSFINKNQSESILLDLKHLLKEAKQRIPPVLMVSSHFPALDRIISIPQGHCSCCLHQLQQA